MEISSIHFQMILMREIPSFVVFLCQNHVKQRRIALAIFIAQSSLISLTHTQGPLVSP